MRDVDGARRETRGGGHVLAVTSAWRDCRRPANFRAPPRQLRAARTRRKVSSPSWGATAGARANPKKRFYFITRARAFTRVTVFGKFRRSGAEKNSIVLFLIPRHGGNCDGLARKRPYIVDDSSRGVFAQKCHGESARVSRGYLLFALSAGKSNRSVRDFEFVRSIKRTHAITGYDY